MIFMFAQQIIELYSNNIQSLTDSLSKQIDDTITQLQIKLDRKSMSDFFEPIYNATISTAATILYNQQKWNKTINVINQSHQDLLNYLSVHQACHARRDIQARQMVVYNNRIVDLNNLDMILEDQACESNGFLEAIQNTTFNSLFPNLNSNSRIQNRYSSTILADLFSKNQYRYPGSGAGFDEIDCITDQFSQEQQIIIGFGNQSNQVIKRYSQQRTQEINSTKQYQNSYSFENNCIDRSIRVFLNNQQFTYNKVPQVLTATEIKQFLQYTNLIEPTMNQIISALQAINDENIDNINRNRLLYNISGKTIFRPTKVIILASQICEEQAKVHKFLEEQQKLFQQLENINIHVEFKQQNSQQHKNNCLDISYVNKYSKIFSNNDITTDKSTIKMFPAKQDEFGQIVFSICSKNDQFLVCTNIPQQGFFVQPQGAIVFQKWGQVLIVDKETLMIYVDSMNQFVGQQFGQQVGNEINDSIINNLQYKKQFTIKLDTGIISSFIIADQFIYVLYLRIPTYTSLNYNKLLFSKAKFNASNLCFNLSYYDQQCIDNKLIVYFPQIYIGSNILSPQESVYMKGVTMTPETSNKLGQFLQFEYDYKLLNQSTYYSIFHEGISGNSYLFFALAEESSYNALKNTYYYIKQTFSDLLYIGRVCVAGSMSIFPDNKLTPRTLNYVYTISLSTIAENNVTKAGIIFKEFDCEYYTEVGIISDKCLYIGIPFQNFLAAQDFFIVQKDKAFLLFMLENKDILKKLDENNLKFIVNSLSWNSLLYNCTSKDQQLINQILFDQGLGSCELQETNEGLISSFKIQDRYYGLNTKLEKASQSYFAIVPLTSSKSTIMVFRDDYDKKLWFQCSQTDNQTFIKHNGIHLVRQWTQNKIIDLNAQIDFQTMYIYVLILILLTLII
ncbi:Conserved_hypothetical protein [Hexamita inflata]|uniref:Uncharacterized protein n=1 Tax=Hexamita inflata TaxID=28002 RepID=A0AA86NXR5_9EUKA|nr:Conserved hypothetical protein [Hexamita inflata]